MKLYTHLVPASGDDGEELTLIQDGGQSNVNQPAIGGGHQLSGSTSVGHLNLTCDGDECHSMHQRVNDEGSGDPLVDNGCAKEDRERDVAISDEHSDVSPSKATLSRHVSFK